MCTGLAINANLEQFITAHGINEIQLFMLNDVDDNDI